MKIVTNHLAKKLPKDHELLSSQIINPQDYFSLCSVLVDIEKLTIYDLTTTQKLLCYTIISVNDHINRTGNNPASGFGIS